MTYGSQVFYPILLAGLDDGRIIGIQVAFDE